MADFKGLLSALRRAEQHFEQQLTGIRSAISSLEMGSAVSPALSGSETTVRRRQRRKMSAAARAKISAAQKRRWAKMKAAQK
jgi:hypothetical protein